MRPNNRYAASVVPMNGFRLSIGSRNPMWRSAELAFGVDPPFASRAAAPTDCIETISTTRPQIRATAPDFVETPPAGANLKKTLGPLHRRDALRPINRLPDSP